jgi:hypothetical protein
MRGVIIVAFTAALIPVVSCFQGHVGLPVRRRGPFCCAPNTVLCSEDTDGLSRRALLQGSAFGLGVKLLRPDPSGATAAEDEEDVDEEAQTLPKLASRFAKGQLKTLGQPGPLGLSDQVTFPDWLEGTWDVTYTFEKASFPLTKDFAQFKQLLKGSIRSPAEEPGEETTVTLGWKAGAKGVEEDREMNLKNYYNAFSKETTIETSKGPRTRKVTPMPSHVCFGSSFMHLRDVAHVHVED